MAAVELPGAVQAAGVGPCLSRRSGCAGASSGDPADSCAAGESCDPTVTSAVLDPCTVIANTCVTHHPAGDLTVWNGGLGVAGDKVDDGRFGVLSAATRANLADVAAPARLFYLKVLRVVTPPGWSGRERGSG